MTGVIVAIVVVVAVALVALAVVARNRARSRALQERFGTEYERLVQEHDDKKAVERELAEREKRHAELPIRALPADARDRYAQEWLRVQEQFVDEPVQAVRAADELVTRVMGDRGYPAEGYEQQLADLSVQHAHTLTSYRSAHEISDRAADGTATTEDLRQAMVHYRSLFEELLGEPVRLEDTREERAERAAEDDPDPADDTVRAERAEHAAQVRAERTES